jgi:hypothetical protein
MTVQIVDLPHGYRVSVCESGQFWDWVTAGPQIRAATDSQAVVALCWEPIAALTGWSWATEYQVDHDGDVIFVTNFSNGEISRTAVEKS